MNTVRQSTSPSQSRNDATERRGAAQANKTTRRRERDFGVGYGKSSGYASADRPYAPTWRQAGFRFA